MKQKALLDATHLLNHFLKEKFYKVRTETLAAKLHPCYPDEHGEPIRSGKRLMNSCEHFGSPASSQCLHNPFFSQAKHSWSGEKLGRNSSACREGNCPFRRCFLGTGPRSWHCLLLGIILLQPRDCSPFKTRTRDRRRKHSVWSEEVENPHEKQNPSPRND